MSTLKITAAPWKIVETKYPFKTEDFMFGNKLIPAMEGSHIERQIHTAWENGQAKACVPVVGNAYGFGTDGAIRFIHIEEGDAKLIKSAPMLLLALQKITEWTNSGGLYGQDNIKKFAKQVLLDAGLDDVELNDFSDFVKAEVTA